MYSSHLYKLPMDYVRRQVARLAPMIHPSCDIDVALAYEALIREKGFRVSFPKHPQGRGQHESGVAIGTLKGRRLRARRSEVQFNWLWITT